MDGLIGPGKVYGVLVVEVDGKVGVSLIRPGGDPAGSPADVLVSALEGAAWAGIGRRMPAPGAARPKRGAARKPGKKAKG